MTNDPGERPDGEDNNPFKGTPFEQIFNAFGGAGGGLPGAFGGAQGAGGMPDLSALMSQMQAMMAPHEGSVNWNLAKDVARQTVAPRSPTRPRPTASAPRSRTRCGSPTSGWTAHRRCPPASGSAVAWSRAEWVEATLPRVAAARRPGRRARGRRDGRRPARGDAGHGRPADRHDALHGRRDVRHADRAGRRRARRRGRRLDRHRPAARPGRQGRAAAAERRGVRQGPRRVRRTRCGCTSRCARPPTSGCSRTCRGCARTCSARSRATRAGIKVDTSQARGRRSRQFDPPNPEQLQEALQAGHVPAGGHPGAEGRAGPPGDRAGAGRGLGGRGGARRPRSPGCRRPTRCARRCAAAGPPGGPAEQTFATLIGLELRPRRLRDASRAVGLAAHPRGVDGRDAVWAHPDMLPTAADLDDPLGFREGAVPPPSRCRTTSSTPRWPTCSTTSPASPVRTPPRARPTREHAARRRAGDPAVLARPGPAPGVAPPGVRRPPRGAPRRDDGGPATPTTSRPAPWCCRPTAAGCC